jgi:hypothetical protein
LAVNATRFPWRPGSRALIVTLLMIGLFNATAWAEPAGHGGGGAGGHGGGGHAGGGHGGGGLGGGGVDSGTVLVIGGVAVVVIAGIVTFIMLDARRNAPASPRPRHATRAGADRDPLGEAGRRLDPRARQRSRARAARRARRRNR